MFVFLAFVSMVIGKHYHSGAITVGGAIFFVFLEYLWFIYGNQVIEFLGERTLSFKEK